MNSSSPGVAAQGPRRELRFAPALMDAETAAYYCGISVPTLWELARKGVLPKTRISEGRVGWRKDVLDEWVQSLPLENDQRHERHGSRA